MKAVLLTEWGMKGNLVFKDIPTPSPSKKEALIKVKYCGVNHLDLLIRQGKRPGPKIFPHILGSEIVGTIATMNQKRSGFEIGDAVAVYPWLFCGRCTQCLSGRENICDTGGTIGRTCWGGYAEYVVAPMRNLVKIPKNISLENVCASTLTATTAHHLIERAKIQERSLVLVTGATGGVGTAVIQLVKNRKCTVVAATTHPGKKKRLRNLGVDHIFSVKNFISEVKKVTPLGVDYVIDLMGGYVWSQAVEVLAKNGTLVFCATTLDGAGSVSIGSAFSRQVNILGSYGGTIHDLISIVKLLETGKLKPHIDSVYPLDHASVALDAMMSQRMFGKILLAP